MPNETPKQRSLLVRGLLALGSGLLWLLSFPEVRNWMWGKAVNKAKQKIIDVQARDVSDTSKKDV